MCPLYSPTLADNEFQITTTIHVMDTDRNLQIVESCNSRLENMENIENTENMEKMENINQI